MAWYRSTTNTTGITTFDTPANALSVLNTFFTACAAEGASYLWTVASYQSTSPRYLVLKRKDATAGRLMFFGGDSPSATVLGQSTTANTTSLYVGYDRTATADSPSTSYVTGRPFGGSVANWHLGRNFGSLTATAGDLRSYCNSSNNTLTVFWTDPVNNVFRGWAIVGDWLRDEGGTAREGLTAAGASTYANGLISEPMSNALAAASSTQSVQYTTVYNSVSNEVVRVACNLTTAIMCSSTQAVQNERLLSPGGYSKFLPFTFTALSGGTIVENRLYSGRYIGWGPMKTLNFQWTDNTAAAKGYYVGLIGTTSDLSGLSLLDDAF